MHRCLDCEEKCLKEEGCHLKVESNDDVKKIYEKFNEIFRENTKWTFFNRKVQKEKRCVFAGESQYDIQEIKRIHNLIFERDGLKVCFIDGGLGSGKSYKVDKVLEYRNASNNKVESLMFESFQTGYNENFIYILFLELVKNKKGKPSFKKHCEVFKNNISSLENFILSIPITLSLLIVFYTVIKVFDFTKQDFISTNVGYPILIFLTVVISLFILPYALTFRKEYTILNRDYYYKLVTKLLPEVLIIDDFERLTENQRRQVYEFINYLRANEIDENKVETNLKRILILGDLKAVESAELLYKEGSTEGAKERITKEAFVTKYYDQRIVLGDWIETFTEKYNTDYPELPLNTAETEHIIKLLRYFSPSLTRREFVMFMNNTNFNYQEKSFEYNLIEELRTTRKEEYWDRVKLNSNFYAEAENTHYEMLLSLILNEIPYYQTYYFNGGKMNKSSRIESLCTQLKPSKVKYLDILLEKIIERGKTANELIDIFDSHEVFENYKNAEFYMFDEGDFKFKFDLNYSLHEYYYANKNVIEIGEISKKTLNVLEQVIVVDRHSLLKAILSDFKNEDYVFSKGNYQTFTFSQQKQIVNGELMYNELADDQINSVLDELNESLVKFNTNFVFNIIKQYEDQFDFSKLEK